MRIFSLALALTIMTSCIFGEEVQFKIQTDWKTKSSIYYELENLYDIDRKEFWNSIEQKSFYENLKNQQTFMSPFKTRLEFLKNLEHDEAEFYNTTSCKLWIKRIVFQGQDTYQVIICENALMKDSQHVITADQVSNEFLPYDKFWYGNFVSNFIDILYIDMEGADTPEYLKKFKETKYNFILRYKMNENDQSKNEHLYGFGIDFRVISYEMSQDRTNREQNIIFVHRFDTKENINNYHIQFLNTLQEQTDFGSYLSLLQNHPNEAFQLKEQIPKITTKELPVSLVKSVLNQQLVIINYKFISLKFQKDILFYEKEINTILKVSELLDKLVKNKQTLYQSMLDYPSSQNNIPFSPPLARKDQAHLRVTDVLRDLRFKRIESSDQFLLSEEYQETLSIKSNAIQIYLYLDISLKGSQPQRNLITSLFNLYERMVAFSLNVIITDGSQEQNSQRIQNMYCQLEEATSESPLNGLQLLDQMFQDLNKEFPYEGTCDQYENQVQNALNVCQIQGICMFPFLIINQNVINQPALLNNLKNITQVENLLFDLILYQSKLIPQTKQQKDYSTFYFSDPAVKYSSFFNEFSTNQIMKDPQDEEKQEKCLSLELSKDGEKSSKKIYVKVTYWAQNKILEKFQSYITLIESQKVLKVDFELITSLNDIHMNMPFQKHKMAYVFVNGIATPFIQSYYQLHNLIVKAQQRAMKLTQDVSLKKGAHPFQIDTISNFYSCVDNQLKTNFTQLIKYSSKFAHHSITLKSKKEKGEKLYIHSHFQSLSLEAVTFLSFINQAKLNFDLVANTYIHQQFNQSVPKPKYHFFRLLYNPTQKTSKYVVKNLQANYAELEMDIIGSQVTDFVVTKISPYFDHTENRDTQNNLVGEKSTLSINNDKWRTAEKGKIQVTFQLKQMQTLIQLQNRTTDKAFAFYPFLNNTKSIIGQIVNRQASIEVQRSVTMLDYFQAIVPKPGKYYLNINFYKNHAIILRFDELFHQYENVLRYPVNLNEADRQDVEAIQKAESQDTINIYSMSSGGQYEFLQVSNLQFILQKFPNEKFRYLFLEGLFMSPWFRQQLIEIQTKYESNFEYEFLNYKWPERLISRQHPTKDRIQFMKITLNHVMIPMDINKLLFLDVDHLYLDNFDIRRIYDVNINNHGVACPIHAKRGFALTPYWVDLIKKSNPGSEYITTSITLFNMKYLRNNPIVMTKLFKAYEGMLRIPGSQNLFLNSQDLVNYLQGPLKVKPLPNSIFYDYRKPDNIDLEQNSVIEPGNFFDEFEVNEDYIKDKIGTLLQVIIKFKIDISMYPFLQQVALARNIQLPDQKINQNQGEKSKSQSFAKKIEVENDEFDENEILSQHEDYTDDDEEQEQKAKVKQVDKSQRKINNNQKQDSLSKEGIKNQRIVVIEVEDDGHIEEEMQLKKINYREEQQNHLREQNRNNNKFQQKNINVIKDEKEEEEENLIESRNKKQQRNQKQLNQKTNSKNIKQIEEEEDKDKDEDSQEDINIKYNQKSKAQKPNKQLKQEVKAIKNKIQLIEMEDEDDEVQDNMQNEDQEIKQQRKGKDEQQVQQNKKKIQQIIMEEDEGEEILDVKENQQQKKTEYRKQLQEEDTGDEDFESFAINKNEQQNDEVATDDFYNDKQSGQIQKDGFIFEEL